MNKNCQYCGTQKATAWLVSGCPNGHVLDTRICRYCYESVIGYKNIHMCRECNRAISDWATQPDGWRTWDQERYPMILSWDRK
jgi:hypothetical protein